MHSDEWKTHGEGKKTRDKEHVLKLISKIEKETVVFDGFKEHGECEVFRAAFVRRHNLDGKSGQSVNSTQKSEKDAMVPFHKLSTNPLYFLVHCTPEFAKAKLDKNRPKFREKLKLLKNGNGEGIQSEVLKESARDLDHRDEGHVWSAPIGKEFKNKEKSEDEKTSGISHDEKKEGNTILVSLELSESDELGLEKMAKKYKESGLILRQRIHKFEDHLFLVGIIIGKGGFNVERMQRDSGCFLATNYKHPRNIWICGAPKEVKRMHFLFSQITQMTKVIKLSPKREYLLRRNKQLWRNLLRIEGDFGGEMTFSGELGAGNKFLVYGTLDVRKGIINLLDRLG